MEAWANEFGEIEQVLRRRSDLRERMLGLVERELLPGKITEGADRQRNSAGS
jgi:hypothetical protein